jgi:hypothetical protein
MGRGRLVCALAGVLMVSCAVGPTQASDAVVSDSLPLEVVRLDARTHDALFRALGGKLGATADIDPFAKSILLASLRSERVACLAGATDDEARGRIWLDWRPLRSLEANGAREFVATLACVDTMCGPEPIVRERLAFLSVGGRHSEVTLIGEPPSALDAYERAKVDSVVVVAGNGFVLIEARRRFDNGHPCIGVVDSHDYEEACFLVLEGHHVRQAFALVPNGEWGSHDDAAGDAALARRGDLRVEADRVELRYRMEETVAPQGGDSARPTVSVIGRGVVRMRRDAKTGRFVRSN